MICDRSVDFSGYSNFHHKSSNWKNLQWTNEGSKEAHNIKYLWVIMWHIFTSTNNTSTIIGNDCAGSCKFNYHTTTAAQVQLRWKVIVLLILIELMIITVYKLSFHINQWKELVCWKYVFCWGSFKINSTVRAIFIYLFICLCFGVSVSTVDRVLNSTWLDL
jgi:hypothetical protein